MLVFVYFFLAKKKIVMSTFSAPSLMSLPLMVPYQLAAYNFHPLPVLAPLISLLTH